MANETLKIDANNKPVAGFVTDDASQEIRMARIDDTTKGLKVMIVGGGGGGTPGGSTTQLQYNNAGSFGGISGATTNGTVVTLTSPIVATSMTANYATASTIAIFDGSKNLITATTATYPSLTELSYVKGVTSAIQVQFTSKRPAVGNEYVVTVSGGVYYAVNPSTAFSTSNASLDTVWSSIQTDIGSNPATITFGVGTFTTTAGLTLAKDNVKIRGMGKGVTTISADSGSGMDSVPILKVDPTQSATGYSLTVDANAGDLTLTMSSANLISSGIVAGDYIILYSSLSIDSEFSSRNQGELHTVVSVNTGTGVITIGAANNGTHVYQTMTTANSAKVAKLTMYQNISVQGITFTDTASSRPNTLITGQVLFRFVDNLTIEDCYLHDLFNSGLMVWQCMDVKINQSYFKNIKDVNPTANVFYGIVLRGATINTSISNCNFNNMRHGVTQGAGTTTYYAGTTRNMTVSNCSSISTFTSHFDVHQGAEGVSFVNNTMVGTMVGDDGAANGIQARSPATITGNSIIGVLGKGISLFGQASGSTVSGNDIKGCTDGVFIDVMVNKVNITGNTMRSGTRGMTLSRSTQTVTMTIASPCVVTTSASHGLTAGTRIVFTNTGGALPTGITSGVTYYISATGLTTTTFQFSATDGGASVNTSGSQSGTHTMAAIGGNECIIANNNIRDNTSVGIDTNSQAQVRITGNTFSNNTLPFQIANGSSTATAWQIIGNYSYNNTSTNDPTILGTNHVIYLNTGFANTTEIPYTRDAIRLRGMGIVSETFPAAAATTSGLMISQTVYYNAIGFLKGDIVTYINIPVVAFGTTTTNCYVAIYDSAGNRLAVSNDLTTALDTSNGMKQCALSAPYTIPSTGLYYAAVLVVNGTPANCPTIARGSSNSTVTAGIGAGVRLSGTQTGQSTMPSTATIVAGSPFAFWLGAS